LDLNRILYVSSNVEGIRRKFRSIKHWKNAESNMMRNVTGGHRYNERQKKRTHKNVWVENDKKDATLEV